MPKHPDVLASRRIPFQPQATLRLGPLGFGPQPGDLPFLAPALLAAPAHLKGIYAHRLVDGQTQLLNLKSSLPGEAPIRGVILLHALKVRGSPNLLLPVSGTTRFFNHVRAFPILIHPNLFMADYTSHPDDDPVEVGIEVTFPQGVAPQVSSTPTVSARKKAPDGSWAPTVPTMEEAPRIVHPSPSAHNPLLTDALSRVLDLHAQRLHDEITEILGRTTAQIETLIQRRHTELLDSLSASRIHPKDAP